MTLVSDYAGGDADAAHEIRLADFVPLSTEQRLGTAPTEIDPRIWHPRE